MKNKSKEILSALLMKGRDLIGFSGVSKTAMLRLADCLSNWGVTVQRHGRWICGCDDQDEWYCSECKHGILPADDLATPYELELNYCEHCGAKMDLHEPGVQSLVDWQTNCAAQSFVGTSE